MTKLSVVIDLPDDIYNKYKHRAELMQRSVEAEIVESVLKSAPSNAELSVELEGLVSQLAFLDNKGLFRLAHSKLAKKETARIESLHFKRQNEGLNEAETQELAELMKRFERWFVLRNEALGILIQRGQDVSEFAPKK
jgi:plasmid stability protein